jgi:hypothetical protein
MLDILTFLCLLIIIGLSLYITIRYSLFIKKLNKIPLATLKSIKINHYNENNLEKLLKLSIITLYNNAQIIAQPYFYNKSIIEILNQIPDYINVLYLSQYISIYEEESNNDIEKKLKIWYGDDYKDSPQLNKQVSIYVSKFNTTIINHFIINDIHVVLQLYKKHGKQIDDILDNIS